jgi:hypothetical protein
METTLYTIRFKNGRLFNVFCANKNQKQRFLKSIRFTKGIKIETVNGIHTVAQWEAMTKDYIKLEISNGV